MASGVQEGFALLHDKDLRTGLWVSYRLSSTDIDGASGRDRVNCFRKDPRLTSAETAILSDYDEPIYDRGHLANDADLKDSLIEQRSCDIRLVRNIKNVICSAARSRQLA